jgi:hypothetical protein
MKIKYLFKLAIVLIAFTCLACEGVVNSELYTSSFLQESDDYVDDDVVADTQPKNRPRFMQKYGNTPAGAATASNNFFGTSTTQQPSNNLFQQPNAMQPGQGAAISPAEQERLSNFAKNVMNDLQKRRSWRPAASENMNEPFNKSAASGGKKNTDEFVSFLGFIRDTSSKASKNIAENEKGKLVNKLKDIKI